MNTAPTASTFLADIPEATARAAYYGTSFHPERRGDSARSEYAAQLAADYAMLHEQATKGGTLDLLPAEFERYRAGQRKRHLAYLHSSARCVSSFIAGPSNFPAGRMNKRADIAHRRLNEMLEHRANALAAIKRTLRPDLRAIYTGDADALDRLEAKITKAEAMQARMRETNATIRRHKKEGTQAQVAALLAMGYHEGTARRLLEPDFCGRIGFADYELTNNGANIRRMKARAEEISRLQNTEATEQEGSAARLEECPAENRVKLFFPGKPSEDVRADLKRHGFRWAPSEGCWKAYLNRIAEARRIAGCEKPQDQAGSDLAQRFAATCAEFQANIERISSVSNLSPLAVFALWREYSKQCDTYDQSAILGEFVEWYKSKLGGNIDALRTATAA